MPLGYGQAADAAHFVAAPLLTSAAVALIGVIGADGDKFRWPGPALLGLALAAMALVGSVQYGFHARALLYSAADVADWWGEEYMTEHGDELRERQHEHFRQWQVKIGRAVLTYNLGTTLLGAGVAACLAPPVGAAAAMAVSRWIAFGAVAAGALGELGWAVCSPRWTLALPPVRLGSLFNRSNSFRYRNSFRDGNGA